MLNVFRDVLKNIEVNGLQEGHHLYISFRTDNKKVVIPNWLKEKHPKEITIVIQYEYWNFKVKNDSFNIGLSFNDINYSLCFNYLNDRFLCRILEKLDHRFLRDAL